MSATGDKVVSRLNGASNTGSDDDRNNLGSGTVKTWRVDLSDVTADVIADISVDISDSKKLRIETFNVNGKWTSHVTKKRYDLRVMRDNVWGDDKRPYGTFSISNIKAIDGAITPDFRIDVNGFEDDPNRYAKERAQGLINGILSVIHQG